MNILFRKLVVTKLVLLLLFSCQSKLDLLNSETTNRIDQLLNVEIEKRSTYNINTKKILLGNLVNSSASKKREKIFNFLLNSNRRFSHEASIIVSEIFSPIFEKGEKYFQVHYELDQILFYSKDSSYLFFYKEDTFSRYINKNHYNFDFEYFANELKSGRFNNDTMDFYKTSGPLSISIIYLIERVDDRNEIGNFNFSLLDTHSD